ncbi:MAG: DHA2 family efflux MFS transporter permease subunit [Bacteroidetes bacterium]|nr:DHA2 family efflux MFS transporter permease subunit [Bacteroidota bacterium]
MVETGFRKFIITFTVILAALLELIDTTVVNVSLPQIMGNLGATLEDVGWVVTAYAVANVIILPMSGWLSNRYGRKNYFTASIILFTIASFFCGNANNIWELVIFRFIQGIGGGGLLSTSQSILIETWPKKQLGTAMALFGLGVVVGPTFGPTLGGVITDHWTWPWIFFVNIPLGIIAVLLTANFIKDSIHAHHQSDHVDWIGIILLTIGIGSLQIVLERGESEDWFNRPYITILSMVSVISMTAFVIQELYTDHPVVNLRIMKNRSLAIGMFTTFILGFGLFSSVFIFPVFCQNLLGFSAQQTGELMIPGGLATIMMMPFVGKMLQRKVPAQILASVGFLFFYLFTITLGKSNLESGEVNFYIPLILRGIGLSMLFVPLTALAFSDVQPKDLAQATGLNNMMRQLGGSFGIALITTLIHLRQGYHRSVLLTHINVYDNAFSERFNGIYNNFIAKGYAAVDAASLAYKAIEVAVLKQTFLLSYMDGFWFTGVVFILCIPLLYLQKFKRSNIASATSH